MKKPTSRQRLKKLHRFKRIIELLVVLVFIFFEAYYIYIQNQPPAETLIDLSIALLVSLLLIEFGFRYVERYQVRLDEQLRASQIQSQRYAALTQLSTELAGTLEEEKIYHKLIQGLHKELGYDSIAILLVDKYSGERYIPTGGSIGWPDIPTNWRVPPGERLTKVPILEDRLFYNPDVKEEPSYIPGINKGSEVDVPLRVAGEVLGILVVKSRETHAFDEDDFRVLTTAAILAAIAINNARLLVDEKTQKRQAETLRAATIALTAALNLDQLLDQLLVRIKEVVPYDSASVFLIENNSTHQGVKRLNIMATKGLPFPERIVGHDFPADDPLFLETQQTASPVILEDARNDHRFHRWGDTDNVRGWMGVPLIARGEVIGYVSLDSHQVGTYGENQAQLAQAFANQAALAIDNARLYHSARQAADRRAILHQVSQEIIAASLKPEKIYQAIHQAASELMPIEAFMITILDSSEEVIDLIYLVDRDQRAPPMRIPKDQGLSGYVIGSGDTLMINDYGPETSQKYRVVRFGTLEQVRSILAVPMRLGDTTFGMLSAQSYQVNAYEEEDKHLLEMLAAHAAIALDNARLFREVQRLAITDDLTGISNRRHFFELAEREFLRAKRYGHPISAVMIDLDYFKLVNDSYGHAVGDQVLRIVANRCRDSIRSTDILGRYGGEEFSIILPETTSGQALEIAERLRANMAGQPIKVDQDTQLSITISLGVSESTEEITSLSSLLNRADSALYGAKQAGRNKVMLKS